jgi:hypothetical protein
MHRLPLALLMCFVAVFCLSTATAFQTTAEPGQVPIVTAENEEWYLTGEPITYDGNLYYRSGALTAFNRNEMMRSGFYRGIPLYTRTTYEPHSVVFVPLPGGFLQPYQRRRAGEIGGTIGSIGPGFPVERADTSRALTSAPQAAGPPTSLPDTPVSRYPSIGATPGVVGPIVTPPPAPVVATESVEPSPAAVGTAGRVVVLPRPGPLLTAARPTGVNGVFVEFDNARWYGSGSAIELEPTTAFQRIGEYHGFPVYTRPGVSDTIYIPVTSKNGHLVTPYSRR